MKSKLTKDQKGFTIIEVLIVLAIAGLILLIVFLAVPALQRNSRNTQRKNDVAAILGAVNEWTNNNNGQVPTTAAQQAEAVANANLGIYAGAVNWGVAWPADQNSVTVAVNQRCTSETTIGAQNRSVSALYRVEAGGGGIPQQCD
jgi:prepilin-type N-terminal cleavage/methylation domain-containing protein